MLEPHSLSHLCPLRSFLESLLRTTVWAPLIWSQNPSDLCISVYDILIVSWPLFECLPKRCFPFGDHTFGTSSFCYIKICSPIISTVGLGSTKGDNTEQMEPFFHGTAYYIIKDSPCVHISFPLQVKHLCTLGGVSGPFTITVTPLLLNFTQVACVSLRERSRTKPGTLGVVCFT